ncbi:MAG: ABC transporter ATP-binding protein [Candidatus Sumerlaeia bacterium]|nr:ABC transporter ATP-binding protein [Candidatus Sumerlaeia bacterium]
MPERFALRGAAFRFPGGPALFESLDLAIPAGQFCAVLGPNGSGKSTLLRLLTGWHTPQQGEALLDGTPLRTLDRGAIARRIAYVPQAEEGLFPFQVLEVVLMGRYPRQRGAFAREGPADHAAALRALADTGLEGFAGRTLDTLSGGERQRVLLARALAQEAPALVLDEPTAALDLARQRDAFELLSRLHRSEGRTIVVATHDANLAARFADRLLLLDRGRAAADGAPREVLRAEILEPVFGARLRVLELEDGTPQVLHR